MKRFLLLAAPPVTLLLVLTFLPLILGWETLFLRDIFNAHLPLKAQQASAMADGQLPLVAPLIAGGQPLMGNLNAVPLYPDNLLYLIGPLLWAFNAHFWLHCLLAPWTAFLLGRAWGLGRPGAWAAGVCFAFSGYYFSQLNLYNLVAGVTLTPALIAAAMWLVAPETQRRWLAAIGVGGVWGLMLLAGDPILALFALGLALGAVVVRGGRGLWRVRTFWPLAAALVCGGLLAAPQIVEFLRVLPLSYRGHQGFSMASVTVASLNPWQALEWLLPLFFGRPDVLGEGAFWGQKYFTGRPPFYFSLFPGLLVFALMAVSGFRRSQPGMRGLRLWAWSAVGVGLFLALGRFNPLAQLLLELFGGLLRYPVKFWLLVAVGSSLLAGLGFERAVAEREARSARLLGRILLVAGGAYAALWAALRLYSGQAADLLTRFLPEGLSGSFAASEVARWSGLAAIVAICALLLAATLFLGRKRPLLAAVLMLVLHAGSQLFFLRPLIPTQKVEDLARPSPLLAYIPPSATVVQGSGEGLFGGVLLNSGNYPEPSVRWIQRHGAYELAPPAGVMAGLRYELNLTPEGLSSFLAHCAQEAVHFADDSNRVRLLAGWGVERLILHRELAPEAGEGARLLARRPSFGNDVFVYEVLNAAPQVSFAGEVYFAPHLNAALNRLVSPAFDPVRMTVLPGEGEPQRAPEGRVRVAEIATESLRATTESQGPGVLVWQRSHLGHYRATVDGKRAPVEVANMFRIAVRLPPGDHEVRVWVDRRPFYLGLSLTCLGLLALLGLAGWLRRTPVSDRVATDHL